MEEKCFPNLVVTQDLINVLFRLIYKITYFHFLLHNLIIHYNVGYVEFILIPVTELRNVENFAILLQTQKQLHLLNSLKLLNMKINTQQSKTMISK